MFEFLQECEARFHVGLPVEIPEVLPANMLAIDLKLIKNDEVVIGQAGSRTLS